MYQILKEKNKDIALINNESVIIKGVQETIDIIADILYGDRIDHIIIHDFNFEKSFYDLKSGLLGGITQKFINYNVKVAIVGNYSIYESNSLNDFIKESNRGRHLFFYKTEIEAIEKLDRV